MLAELTISVVTAFDTVVVTSIEMLCEVKVLLFAPVDPPIPDPLLVDRVPEFKVELEDLVIQKLRVVTHAGGAVTVIGE